MNLRRFRCVDDLASAVAQRFVELSNEAIEGRGRFIVALAGGNTPRSAYQLLARDPHCKEVEWEKVHVYWGDERYVPPGDPASNERMARETLLSRVPIPEVSIHPIYLDGGPEVAAHSYEGLLNSFGPTFDLVLAGMGPDGHTLSLFPGTLSTLSPERLCVATKANVGVPDRVTLTAKAVSTARRLLFLVAGADKADRLAEVLLGPLAPDRLPAQLVWNSTPASEWWVDDAAAALLPP